MKINTHKDLEVYKLAFESAQIIFELSKKFPVEEKYALTDQIRRSSRSVCANLAEAYRKRKYSKLLYSKITECISEASETQTWLDFAIECGYLDKDLYDEISVAYDHIIGKLVNMSRQTHKWTY